MRKNCLKMATNSITTMSLTNVFLAGRLFYVNSYHSLKVVKHHPCFIGMKILMWKVKLIIKSYLGSFVITFILTVRLCFWKHLEARTPTSSCGSRDFSTAPELQPQ